jgi:quercetin 2,3-dioxygenase
LASERKCWIQVLRGSVALDSHDLVAGDGVAIVSQPDLSLTAKADDTEMLVFDLP